MLWCTKNLAIENESNIFIIFLKQEKEKKKIELFKDNYNMLPMITGFISHARYIYIGQGFMIILSHTNRLHVFI